MTSMVDAAPRGDVHARSALASPPVVLAVVALLLAALLTLRLRLPVGPMYWDLFIYFDAANRIFDGQVPSVDFFAPVGPLGYWLFAAGLKLFPNAQPLLLVEWSLLVVTAPLMGLVVADVDRRSRGLAFALLAPFLVFSILPINVEQFYSHPGFDAFGIYNRQTCQTLYVLCAALVFLRDGWRMTIVVAAAMLALFLTKITGVIAGGLLCAFALAAGRLSLRTTFLAALVFCLALAALEPPSGFVGAYLGDILALVRMNEESILPRFHQAASIHFGILLPAAMLTAALLAFAVRAVLDAGTALLRTPTLAGLFALLDRDVFWLATAVLAAWFFETQNTGGQAFIFIWPVLLRILVRSGALRGGRQVLVLSLIAATALPPLVDFVSRAGRAAIGQIRYEALELANLKTLGAVTQKPSIIRHARTMLDIYAAHPDTYAAIADAGELPSFTLFGEPDFQITWLMSVDAAVAAVKDYEAISGARFATILSLDFVDPFPWLLDRRATRHVAIGADPFRAVPQPGSAVGEAVRATDLVLYPKCPVTVANRKLLQLYAPFLTDHRRMALTPCWDAFVRSGP